MQESQSSNKPNRVVDEYADTGASCPDLCVRYDVDIREFVILAFLKDVGPSDAKNVGEAAALSPTTTHSCLANLLDNGLVRLLEERTRCYTVTADGLAMLRKAGR